MKENILILLTAISFSYCQPANEKKILYAIEERLKIDTKDYNVEFTKQDDLLGVYLTHKTHLEMIKKEKKKAKQSGYEYIPTPGDICSNCLYVEFNADSSKIIHVIGMQ